MTRKKQLDRSRKWAKRKGGVDSPAPRDSSLARVLDELQTAAFKITADREQAALLKDLLHQSPLLAAAYSGHSEAVDCLLKAGRNPNSTAKDGTTPLMLAVAQGHVNLVSKLLEEGADAWIISKDGRSALQMAVQAMDPIIFNVIWNHLETADQTALSKSSKSLLHIASEVGWDFCVAFLLKYPDTDVEQKGKDGKTALMVAAAEGRDGVVTRLLSSGAQILREDQSGATAACWAVARRHLNTAKVVFQGMLPADRETYVRKRISLLTSPTTSGRDTRTFYRELLVRVLVTIRLTMEDGVRLLLLCDIFGALITCCRRHLHDTFVLNPLLHLCACLQHDKAPFSKYIHQDMTEAFIKSSGLDFITDVLNAHPSETQTCCTGLLPLFPAAELEAGRLWVKQHLDNLLPAFRGFSLRRDFDFYCTDGEKVKTAVMWERFKETFLQLYREQYGTPLEISEESCVAPEEVKGTVSRKRLPVECVTKRKSSPVKKKSSNKKPPRQQLQIAFRETFRITKDKACFSSGATSKETSAGSVTFDVVPTAPPSAATPAGQLWGYANAVKSNLPKRDITADLFQEAVEQQDVHSRKPLGRCVMDALDDIPPVSRVETTLPRPKPESPLCSFPLRRSSSAPSLSYRCVTPPVPGPTSFRPKGNTKIGLACAVDTLSTAQPSAATGSSDSFSSYPFDFHSLCGAEDTTGDTKKRRERQLPCQLLHSLQESVLRDILQVERRNRSTNGDETAITLTEAALKAMDKVAEQELTFSGNDVWPTMAAADSLCPGADSGSGPDCLPWWKEEEQRDVSGTSALYAKWVPENQRWKHGYHELAHSFDGTLVNVRGIFYRDESRFALSRRKDGITDEKPQVFLALARTGKELLLKKIEQQSSIFEALNRIRSFRKLDAVHRNLVSLHVTWLCSQRSHALYVMWPPEERNLVEHVALLKQMKYPLADWGKTAIAQILDGLRFLHGAAEPILHGRLKPSNVLVSSKAKILLTDFGLQGILTDLPYGVLTKDDQDNAVTDISWRPRELIYAVTPEMASTFYTTASDMQMAGMVAYFLVSGLHPYGSNDGECQANILRGYPRLRGLGPDIGDFVNHLITLESQYRLSAAQASRHPLFWGARKRLFFLSAVALEVERDRRVLESVAKRLEIFVNAADWVDKIPVDVLSDIFGMPMPNATICDLLHVIRRCTLHYDSLSSEARQSLRQPELFFEEKMPSLFMDVHAVVRRTCLRNCTNIEAFF